MSVVSDRPFDPNLPFEELVQSFETSFDTLVTCCRHLVAQKNGHLEKRVVEWVQARALSGKLTSVEAWKINEVAENLFADKLTFTNQTQTAAVNRFVLQTMVRSSPYMAGLLSPHFSEKRDNIAQIALSGAVFSGLMEYYRTGKVDDFFKIHGSDPDILHEFFLYAQARFLEDLIDKACACISHENVACFLYIGLHFEYAKLRECAFTFLESHLQGAVSIKQDEKQCLVICYQNCIFVEPEELQAFCTLLSTVFGRMKAPPRVMLALGQGDSHAYWSEGKEGEIRFKKSVLNLAMFVRTLAPFVEVLDMREFSADTTYSYYVFDDLCKAVHDQAAYFKKLKKLYNGRFGNCLNILKLQPFFAGIGANLELLDFSGRSYIDRDLFPLLRKQCPNIKTVILGNLGDGDLKQLRECDHAFETLSLKNCTNITCQAVRTIADSCPQLLSLNLEGCFFEQDVEAFDKLFAQCPKLTLRLSSIGYGLNSWMREIITKYSDRIIVVLS